MRLINALIMVKKENPERNLGVFKLLESYLKLLKAT